MCPEQLSPIRKLLALKQAEAGKSIALRSAQYLRYYCYDNACNKENAIGLSSQAEIIILLWLLEDKPC